MKPLAALIALLFAASAAGAETLDDLLAEAQSAYAAAGAATGDESLGQYRLTMDLLTQISVDYPGSDPALSIVLQEAVGDIDVAALAQHLEAPEGPGPAAAIAMDAADQEAEDLLELKRRDRLEIQRRLLLSGFDPNGIDGVFGPGTRQAIEGWQDSVGLPVSGFLNEEQLALLQEQSQEAFVAASGSEATEADLELSANQRREIQRRLSLAGFDPKGVDGVFGPGTRAALSGWQVSQGYYATSFLNRAQLRDLRQQTRDAFQSSVRAPNAGQGGGARADRPNNGNAAGWYRRSDGMICRPTSNGDVCREGRPRPQR